ncbi:MAG: hypothetical protein H6Q73_1042 [Firmicutes bacterium]|nr:hypothetical protein [Bacillota bacterium]
MSLKYILLGFLNIKNMTGYELKHFFDDSVNNFWNANLSQIYPTLNEMKEKGYLEMDIQINDNSPNSKIYRITEKGQMVLTEWMEQSTPLPQIKKLFLAKLLIGAKFKKSFIVRQLEEQLALHESMLEALKEKLKNPPKNITDNTDNKEARKHEFFRQLIIDAGIKEEIASIEWCKETIDKINQMNYAD